VSAFFKTPAVLSRYESSMNARGSFEIKMSAQPPFDVVEGVSLSRVMFDKVFAGELAATSKVEMLAARTPVTDSAGYVAIERIVGTLAGRNGSFVVMHMGTMTRGVSALSLTIVPDSGTGELDAIAGTMKIEIVEGKHFYEIEYSLG
jgi:hypothetical protein